MSFMTAPIITALYAGILGLVAIGIAMAAGRVRGSTGITIGDGGNVELIVAMRRHGQQLRWPADAPARVGGKRALGEHLADEAGPT